MADGINILIPIIAVVVALVIAVPVACRLAVAKKSEAGCGKNWHCGGKSKKHH